MFYYVISYFLGIVLFIILDALFFNIEWRSDSPGYFLSSVLWPGSIPIILFIQFFRWSQNIKNKRIKLQKDQLKLRISAQKEIEAAMKDLDINETKNKNRA